MTIEALLQDVNLVLDWHDTDGRLDCYQAGERATIALVDHANETQLASGHATLLLLTIWRESPYYDNAREIIQRHFQEERRSALGHIAYRRELPDKSFSMDGFEFGDDLTFYIHADGADGSQMYWDEFDRPERAVEAALAWVAKGEVEGDTVEIQEERNAYRHFSLQEAIERYGVEAPA